MQSLTFHIAKKETTDSKKKKGIEKVTLGGTLQSELCLYLING